MQGLGENQELVRGLGSQYRVSLSSSKGEIELNVIASHDSKSNIVQCLLKPEEPLLAGVRYELVVRATGSDNEGPIKIGFTENSYNTRFPYGDHEFSFEPRSWKVLDNPNAGKSAIQQMLQWEDDPFVYNELAGLAQATGEMINFEISFVNFKFSMQNDRLYFVKVMLLHKQTQEESTLFAIPNRDIIPLGRPNK